MRCWSGLRPVFSCRSMLEGASAGNVSEHTRQSQDREMTTLEIRLMTRIVFFLPLELSETKSYEHAPAIVFRPGYLF